MFIPFIKYLKLILVFVFLFILSNKLTFAVCPSDDYKDSNDKPAVYGIPEDDCSTLPWNSPNYNWYSNFEFNGNVYSAKNRTTTGNCSYDSTVSNISCGFTIFKSTPNTGLYITPTLISTPPYRSLKRNTTSLYTTLPYEPEPFTGFATSTTNNSGNFNFDYPVPIPSTMLNISNFTGSNFLRFNYYNIPTSTVYTDLKPYTGANPFEIIFVGNGKGIRIDLNDENFQPGDTVTPANYDRYIIINLNKNDPTNIQFNVRCMGKSVYPNYATICHGSFWNYILSGGERNVNFKGAIYGPFSVSGFIFKYMKNMKFVRIHENMDAFLYIAQTLAAKKYEKVTSTLTFLKYE